MKEMLLTVYSFFSDTLPPCPANWEGLEGAGLEGGETQQKRNQMKGKLKKNQKTKRVGNRCGQIKW